MREIGWLSFKTSTWKLRGNKKGFWKGRCPLCTEDKAAARVLLKCSKTKKLREKLVNRKWLMLHEGISYRSKLNCNDIMELSNIGVYLSKIRC
jgi:hypothetical protein